MRSFIWLTYIYRNFKFEFKSDSIHITDIQEGVKYELSFSGSQLFPFVIQMIEKGIKDDLHPSR